MSFARTVFNQFFKREWEASGAGKSDFARSLGLSVQLVNDVLVGRRNVTVEHLDALARRRDVPLSFVLRDVAHFAFDLEGQRSASMPTIAVPGGVARESVGRAINGALRRRGGVDQERTDGDAPLPPDPPIGSPRR